MSDDYTGDAIRVRRSTDNAELNIGFIGGELDTQTLTTFCGSANGFVSVWFDQSGNGNDATQTTTANQPKVYDSVTGVLLENAKPIIDEMTLAQGMLFSSVIQATNQFIVFVGSIQNQNILIGSNDYFVFVNGGSTFVRANSVSETYTSPTTANQTLLTYTRDGSESELFQNAGSLGTSTALSAQVSDYDGIATYGRNGSNNFRTQEIILYPSDQSANRLAIETDVNDFYQMYWSGAESRLLDSHPNAAAAFSLRALNSNYTGPLVRVRRASDNAEQNILATYDGELNVNALAAFCAGTNGFIVRWYDQSGSGNDAVQATTANQPKIYDSATGVVTENGKPAFETDGTDDVLTTAGVNCASNFQLALVGATLSGGFGYFTNLASSDDGIEILNFGTSYRFSIEGNDDTIAITLGNQSVAMFAYEGTSKIYSINGTENVDALTTTVSVSAGLEFGKRIGSSPVNAVYQEFVLWNSDTHISNRAAIEANINANYLIYNQSPTGLLATYPGAAAAYSLRQLISTARFAIAVRRDSDDAVLGIGFVNGELDTTTLTSFCSGTDGYVSVWFDQ